MKYKIGELVITKQGQLGVIYSITERAKTTYDEKLNKTIVSESETENYYSFGVSSMFIKEEEILGKPMVEK